MKSVLCVWVFPWCKHITSRHLLVVLGVELELVLLQLVDPPSQLLLFVKAPPFSLLLTNRLSQPGTSMTSVCSVNWFVFLIAVITLTCWSPADPPEGTGSGWLCSVHHPCVSPCHELDHHLGGASACSQTWPQESANIHFIWNTHTHTESAVCYAWSSHRRLNVEKLSSPWKGRGLKQEVEVWKQSSGLMCVHNKDSACILKTLQFQSKRKDVDFTHQTGL